MFHYFTLEEVYEYAVRMGYGREYTESWYWEFESLEQPSVYYEHREWEA